MGRYVTANETKLSNRPTPSVRAPRSIPYAPLRHQGFSSKSLYCRPIRNRKKAKTNRQSGNIMRNEERWDETWNVMTRRDQLRRS